MLDSALAIRSYLSGVNREAFLNNPEKQDAVLRRFEIIGEASNRLSPSTRALFPIIPFRSIRGMCNIIAHNYGHVDIQQVWETASRDLETLIQPLQNYFENQSS